MSSKRKTPARKKTTQNASPVSAVVAPPAPCEAPAELAIPSAAASTPVHLPPPPPPRMSRDDRHRIIAKVAYGYAERAGFRNNPVEDWLRAEREVDATLERLAS